NACQTRHVKGRAFAPESDALLGLETYVAHQSRGHPVQPPADPRLQPFVQQGQKLYVQRIGQLDFSCAQCHDQQAGRRLAGSTIPQAHPTGYPLYRLEWQAVGSLQRRLRHCMSGVRAEPYAFASDELTALELYLMQRAAGMPIETPVVRP
ncbi:MAG: sulfur oxidation c-type cytochrome SoxA, partial [Rubrivivax sp.]|nr:sulfur oxidation c-type cytochrome SoxA [Rubrivivax sp.]